MADGGDAEDKDSKTEEPSQHRLNEALKKGQVPFSREVSSFLILFVLAVTIAWYLPGASKDILESLTPYIARAEDFPMDHAGVGFIFLNVVMDMGAIMITPMLMVVAAAILSSLMQNGVIISAEPMKPKLEKISIIKGLKRMFSMRSVMEFIKGLLKIGIVGVITYFTMIDDLPRVMTLIDSEVTAILAFLIHMAVKVMMGVCVAMFFIALIDMIYQRFDYIKNLRMSKKELKDEYKQQEGDPIVKQRLRQIRMERAQNRMMSAVPDADVVITNPTHFSVALKYDGMAMQAPVLVAKGQDHIAFKIREVAKENDVPIVENAPLARALFDSVDIDQEIPMQHYEAVAEIISYVYKLKGKIPVR